MLSALMDIMANEFPITGTDKAPTFVFSYLVQFVRASELQLHFAPRITNNSAGTIFRCTRMLSIIKYSVWWIVVEW